MWAATAIWACGQTGGTCGTATESGPGKTAADLSVSDCCSWPSEPGAYELTRHVGNGSSASVSLCLLMPPCTPGWHGRTTHDIMHIVLAPFTACLIRGHVQHNINVFVYVTACNRCIRHAASSFKPQWPSRSWTLTCTVTWCALAARACAGT